MSSFFDSASLVQIPSGYSDGTLYSVKPIDGTGDLTFSRGSDIEATRVASNGYIQKAKVNLLLQSNTYDNASWLTSGTITGGESGYDGTNDAWLFNSDGSSIYQSSPITSGVVTFSVYAKAGSLDGIRLRIDEATATDSNCYIDLTDGSEIISHNGIALKVEDAGSGWWRISLTHNASNLALLRFYATDDTGGAVAGTIYLQDAQLNYGLVAQEYQETTTTSVVSGITNDMPRLDYSGGASCPSLLLEPSRQNLAVHSEYFNSYSATRLGVSANSATSPEGVTNATKLTPTTDNASHYFVQTNNVTSSQKTTISFYAKADGYNFIRAVFSSVNGAYPDYYQSFDLSDGSLSDDSSGIDSASVISMGNGWYRCIATATAAASVVSSNYFFVCETSGITAFAGNGTSGVLIYGLQVETNVSYPTSYIPCYGTSLSRLADDMDTTFASPFATDGGATFFLELDAAPQSGSNSTAQNLSIVFASGDSVSYNHSGGIYHRWRVNAGGTAYYQTVKGQQDNSVKMAIKITASSFTAYSNGSIDGTPTSISGNWASATDLSTLLNEAIGIIPVKKLIFFPTALSDSDLATLTA